ncbi:FimV/HubP family polar landmark protein, partial [Aliivibrio sifiae]
MSDASKKLLKTLTPLALFVASQCSVANAAGTIQIVGPEGKDKTVSSQVVTQSQPARATTTPATVIKERKSVPTKVYGPTREDETLWSIASRVNPSNTTSVQQTLIAIYRLNPQAFENNNIHGLEPNSRLRLPTLEQVRRENTDDAKQLLIAHKKKQAPQHASAQKTARSTTTEKAPVSVKKEVAPTVNKVKPSAVEAKPTKDIIKVATPSASAVKLKSELETTEQEFSALQENNHQLRVRLAEVQNEVDNLKNSLGDEDRIRSEVEKFINEQKQLAAAEKKAEPSAMDNLASSPGLIALLALIPGVLIAGLIAFFLFRRKKEEDEESSESAGTEQPSALIMPDDNFNMDDDIPEISLDDDDDLLGDLNDDKFLFGDDDSDSSDDLFAEFETENNNSDNDDPFASLDGEENDDLDSMLSDEELDLDLDLDGLDDDIDMSSSALTVDAEEKALGLEEMEKALNDFDSDLFSASDLEEEDDDFDLSLIDDSDLSALDKSTPELEDNEDLEGGELDQSMLDDLFSSMDMEDDSEESELDQGWDLDEKEETKLAPEVTSTPVEDELDFDTLLSGIEDTNKLDEEPNKGESIELDNDDIDAALFGEQNEDSVNLESEEDATTLLDELLEESDDEESIELDIEDDSTALLDELLDESDNEEDSIDLDIEDDSTALLDELLGDDEELSEGDDDIELDEDSTVLLDELLADEDEEETIELGEDSTVLLDELLGDDVEEEETTSGKSGDDTEVEGVAVSETISEDAPRDEDWLIEADEDEDDDIPLFESDTKQ